MCSVRDFQTAGEAVHLGVESSACRFKSELAHYIAAPLRDILLNLSKPAPIAVSEEKTCVLQPKVRARNEREIEQGLAGMQ